MIDNLHLMQNRLNYCGGVNQIDRYTKGTYDNLKNAIKYGSNSQTIRFNLEEKKVLINDSKLNPNYEDKIIAAPYDYNLKPGDIVEWKETNSYWIVYLQDASELAYFRAQMRKCHNELITQTSLGPVSVRASVDGSDAALIKSDLSSGNVVDIPNLTIQLFIPNTEDNCRIFKRYTKFNLDNKTWEIQSVNAIDMQGILIVYAQENYEIVEQTEKENNDTTEGVIKGKLIIKPLEEVNYYLLDNSIAGFWTIEENKPVTIINNNDKEITIKWNSMKSGSFTLSFGDYSQNIIVESLF